MPEFVGFVTFCLGLGLQFCTLRWISNGDLFVGFGLVLVICVWWFVGVLCICICWLLARFCVFVLISYFVGIAGFVVLWLIVVGFIAAFGVWVDCVGCYYSGFLGFTGG